jgi:hypothetical protein
VEGGDKLRLTAEGRREGLEMSTFHGEPRGPEGRGGGVRHPACASPS